MWLLHHGLEAAQDHGESLEQQIVQFSSAVFEAINPATELPFAKVALASIEDVDAAVIAARSAFETFGTTTPAERIELLRAIIAGILAREDDLMAAISLEIGAPMTMTAHVRAGLDSFYQAIDLLGKYSFESQLGGDTIRREPIGVCGLIVAWNWPLQLLCNKVSSALAAGCTIVAKPSEFTSVSAILFSEILHEAGVPKGVFYLVVGDGQTVGHAISSHPDVDFVSITGSMGAGAKVAAAAAPSIKRVSQELGGKSAHIILSDADLEAAARWNVIRAFSNCGQGCSAPTRGLVPRNQVDEVISFMQSEVMNCRVGDPQDSASTMGPVANQNQFRRIQSYIQSGLDEGARLVCGGTGRPEGMERGYFVQPTIFADATQSMTICQEEIFGPVLAVMAYDTVEEAIEIANDTTYGLAGYVSTTDHGKGLTVARRIRAGRLHLNGAPPNASAPMGGYKMSGNGREMGRFGLEEYLEVKALIGFEVKE
jgi:aldehyde dehydrogenase (NAD+)